MPVLAARNRRSVTLFVDNSRRTRESGVYPGRFRSQAWILASKVGCEAAEAQADSYSRQPEASAANYNKMQGPETAHFGRI